MATYKYPNDVQQIINDAFDKVYAPGDAPPFSGIYKCTGCGQEVVAEESRAFPPQNHRQHGAGQGAIQWRLIVYANHRAT